ncbi:phospholipid:diacylglycerol acyltransferase [Yamadazyma tenuis]|uniref:LACT-domain-containing protein n=1 Tax=Candida tenuis (strain ATCC 10573 / BCRC 21748 / CBS 615 / JCM 9827 / NBRC 10315 / NRRL Y-1498 / VKM Y-70) TaxID=590646 RepID=G3AY29_CANTC|nr:LACT-domain-containing protein [Yamadazyma tenuis ATCC 10573]EGV65759.1 LACT-domain-containing protein [Yamadazyma tenuis ATCC 10573]WEJ95922.1 phospholipid:diacylglycerol acyltransferase [Yamadazyma tenuis]
MAKQVGKKDKKQSIEEVAVNEGETTHLHHKYHPSDSNSEPRILKKKLHQSRRVIFILGAVIGLCCAVFFSTSSERLLLNDLDNYVNFDSFSDFFGEWRDMVPASFQSMISDIKSQESDRQLHGSAESFSVGQRMASTLNLKSKHNVVMVPGVISTGLESWGSSTDGDCPSINHFRKRLWGSFYMLRTMVLDKSCWLKHIMLDPETGLDPENVKVRAAQGFEAADFFIAGYWIWNKILQNLAVIGYGPDNMLSASYDWRLAYLDLEKRDHYFSKLKAQIELNYLLSGEQTTLIGHSMGSQVIFYFLKWVEAKGEYYGNGGSSWCNTYLAAVVDISGSSLGTPKTLTALMSGEMKDTVQLNALAVYGLEKFFSRKERSDMCRTFGGIPSMIPKGGDIIWGNLTHAPDDPTNTLATENALLNDSVSLKGSKSESFGTFIRLKSEKTGDRNLSLTDSIDLLLDTSPDWFSNRVREQYSFGIAHTQEELERNNHDHSKWANPLEASLPNAPGMKYYCFYGVGNPTERAYSYHDAEKESNLSFTIDSEAADPVYFGDGDGTVSLLTHSACHVWKKNNTIYNPGKVSVTVVEIKHEPDRFDIRGGAKTAEHVDILGSAELNELILKVVAGKGDTIEDRYISELKDIVAGMPLN